MTPADHAARLLMYVSSQLNDNRALARECYRAGRELADLEQLRAALRAPDKCRRCGGTIVNASTGRPRVYCRECRPPETRRKLQDA